MNNSYQTSEPGSTSTAQTTPGPNVSQPSVPTETTSNAEGPSQLHMAGVVSLPSVSSQTSSNELDMSGLDSLMQVDAFQDYMQEQISLEFADDCVHAPPLFTPPFTNTTVTSIQPPLLMVSTNTCTTRKRKQYSSHATSNRSTI